MKRLKPRLEKSTDYNAPFCHITWDKEWEEARQTKLSMVVVVFENYFHLYNYSVEEQCCFLNRVAITMGYILKDA